VGLDHSSERSVCEDGGYSVRYEAVDGGCGCRRKPRVTEISFNGKSKGCGGDIKHGGKMT